MSLESGQKLAHYEILRPIGKGGMGEVYLAEDTKLKREVALKVLPEALRGDDELAARFRREAEAAARLKHANIATIFSLEQHDDVTFIVMEFVEGQTLSKRIPAGGMDPTTFFSTFIPIADALAHAHHNGRIHRDLKPANMMLDDAGSPKILDFGLARIIEPEQRDLADSSDPTRAVSAREATSDLTEARQYLGTPKYMSPEQAQRLPADARSDIFSLGVVMYEALTGKCPFDGESMESLLARILEVDPRPVTEVKAGAPHQLWWVIRSCLRKRPEDRLQTAAELGSTLREARQEVESGATWIVSDATARRRGAWRWPVALSMTAVAFAAAWTLKPRSNVELPLRTFNLQLAPADADLTTFVGDPAISRDGRSLAFARDSGLWIRELDAVTPRQLVDTEGARYPFWSPEGTELGFFKESTSWSLRKVPVSGGAITTVSDLSNADPRGAAWLNDDTIVFGLENGDLHRVSAQGGQPAVYVEAASYPQSLGAGDGVVFSTAEGLAVIRGGERRVVLHDPEHALAFPSLSLGHIVYQRGNQGVWAARFDESSLDITGAPFLIDERARNPTAASDGTLVHLSTTSVEDLPAQLVWLDRRGNVTPFDELREGLQTPALSPDGRRVAFDAIQDGNRDVWVLDIERGSVARLTFDANVDRHPVWSPDGERVAFQSRRSGTDIYVTRSDGSGKPELAVDETGTVVPNTWTHDGTRIIYTHYAPDTGQDLMITPVAENAETTTVLKTARNEGWGSLSHDGEYIVYDSNESGRFEIYVMPTAGGGRRWQLSSQGGSWPRWSPRGDEIFFVGGPKASGFGPLMAVPVETQPDFEADVARKLVDPPGPINLTWFSVSADAARFLAVRKDPEGRPLVTATIVQNWVKAYE